jgi:hypothetical protein
MKQGNKTVIPACLAIALSGLFSAATVFAAPPSDYVKFVSLSPQDGINTSLIVLKNVSANKHVDAVQVQATTSDLGIGIDGHVGCAESNDIKYDKARAYFGPISANLYSSTYHPSFTEGKGSKRLGEAGNSEKFSVPLAQIKQGHPAVRFDPIQELNKALQKHLDNGGSKLSFYQQDHFIQVERTVSLEGWCRLKGSSNAKSKSAETTVTLTVKYEGDPSLKSSGTLNAQLANLPDQIKNNQPMKLEMADFQPNIPHYYGQCMPEQDPTIRINLQFSGSDTALLDLKVVSYSNFYGDYGVYHEFNGLPVNSQYSKHIDFKFPLKAMLSQDKYAYMAFPDNKVWNHNMKIVARVKPEGKDWGPWQDYGTADFKHRCEPQVKFNSPAQIGGYQNNGDNQPVPGPNRITPVQIKPVMDKGKIQAPTKPSPVPVPGPDSLRAPAEETPPQLQLKALPQQ